MHTDRTLGHRNASTRYVVLGVATAALTLSVAALGLGAQQPAAPPDPAAVARGRQTFADTCAACHGADARGGAFGGVDLTQSAIAVANDGGRALAAFLKVGRPEQKMPSFALADDVVADLSAYVRSLAPGAGRGGAGRGGIIAIVVGDAKAGEGYFSRAGCATCHSVTGDLKGIGTRYDVATIQGRAVMPRGNGGYPRGFASLPDPKEAPRTVTVTEPSGRTLSGTLVWITDFFVTLTDPSGVRRTVARNGDRPKVVVVDPVRWHVDHMKTLTDKDMHDLTAYLVTLK